MVGLKGEMYMKISKTFRIDRYATIAALPLILVVLTTSCSHIENYWPFQADSSNDAIEEIENDAKVGAK